MNTLNKISFLGGGRTLKDIERLNLPDYPRVVFAGRSNVGKSSLLNLLTKAKIARTSQTPGKTTELNFFLWNVFGRHCILVDLPGYGYAKVSASLRESWGKGIAEWLKKDGQVVQVFGLVDSRHCENMMEQDVELIDFLKSFSIPFSVVFTKMDKWKSNNQKKKAEKICADQAENLNVDTYFFTTSMDPVGVAVLKSHLEKILTAK